MRISKIQGVDYSPKQNDVNQKVNTNKNINMISKPEMSLLPSHSYGRDLVNINKKQPVFTGNISKTAIELAQQLPLEERLASLFQILHHGEVIVVGKDFNRAQIALKKNLQKMKQVITKEIFVPDKKIENFYAFIKNLSGDIEALNINDKNISYITGGKNYYLEPGTSFYVVNNDTIQYGNDILHLKEAPKTDLSFSRPMFSQVYDYAEEVQQEIAKLNGKTISKRILQDHNSGTRVTFASIGGQTKAIDELKKGILFPVKYPMGHSGEDITRGYILYGPPGTGKTELCRALANESGMNYMYLSGTNFESKWVGESEANVRAWFDELKANQPSIGVIDEIDAIGKERGDGDPYGAKLVNQILTCMTDIYNENNDVFILGLTNKYDSLDGALKRAERFSKHILVGAPDRDGVKEILKIHTKNRPLDKNINMDELTDKLYEIKAVGSDIKYVSKLARENMMNRLGLYEKMEKGTFTDSDMTCATITQEDFLNAIEAFKEQHRRSSRNPIGFNKR